LKQQNISQIRDFSHLTGFYVQLTHTDLLQWC